MRSPTLNWNRLWRLTAVTVVAGGALAGITTVAGGGAANASGSADLSAKQFVSNGTGSGNTTVTDHIHNAGPSTATNLVEVALLKDTGAATSYFNTTGGTCQQEPAPSGWNFMFTCQLASLASGHTWEPKFSLTSTNGAPFTRFLSVGESGPGDPTLSNNSSTLNSFFGSEADLSLRETATAGASTGKVTVTNTTTNQGPWTANSLQFVAEINSPGFSSVFAASNLGGSCQFIPPASGFNAAVACTTASLTPGQTWTETFSYTGSGGESLVQRGTVTANNPTDPAITNNTANITTKYAT